MFQFSIRDVLWLMLPIGIIAGLYWNQQHLRKPPCINGKTVGVTVNDIHFIAGKQIVSFAGKATRDLRKARFRTAFSANQLEPTRSSVA